MLLRNEAHLSSQPAIDALRKLSSILCHFEQCTEFLERMNSWLAHTKFKQTTAKYLLIRKHHNDYFTP